jgi:hypothetical protein
MKLRRGGGRSSLQSGGAQSLLIQQSTHGSDPKSQFVHAKSTPVSSHQVLRERAGGEMGREKEDTGEWVAMSGIPRASVDAAHCYGTGDGGSLPCSSWSSSRGGHKGELAGWTLGQPVVRPPSLLQLRSGCRRGPIENFQDLVNKLGWNMKNQNMYELGTQSKKIWNHSTTIYCSWTCTIQMTNV